MFKISDSARDEIVRVLDEKEEKKAVRVYVAGHG